MNSKGAVDNMSAALVFFGRMLTGSPLTAAALSLAPAAEAYTDPHRKELLMNIRIGRNA